MLILKASSNATIFAVTQRRRRTKLARRAASRLAAKWGQRENLFPRQQGAVDRASESSGPNRTTIRKNNENKENRHA
jgi:hypothetical protein